MIKAFKSDEVCVVLTNLGVRGIMVTETKGFGASPAIQKLIAVQNMSKFCPQAKTRDCHRGGDGRASCGKITTYARTGKIDDGRILVLDAEQVVRVRAGETAADTI